MLCVLLTECQITRGLGDVECPARGQLPCLYQCVDGGCTIMVKNFASVLLSPMVITNRVCNLTDISSEQRRALMIYDEQLY
jgi:hypothetical protein